MSKIEWTNETWNPLAGCTRVSAGCDYCYAAAMALRLEAMGQEKYKGVATRNGRGVAVFTGNINLDYSMLERPLSWRKPRLVFVNSMSDLFHRNVSDEFIMAVFDVMKRTPRHTYQLLTKRPERMAAWQRAYMPDGLPANVWAGTSVENQGTADERIPHLLKVGVDVRFLSCEPLLGQVDVKKFFWPYCTGKYRPTRDKWLPVYREGQRIGSRWPNGIHWVIVGGESGHNARPMHPYWARSLRDQCQEAGVPFFFKQNGAWDLVRKIEPIVYDGKTLEGLCRDPRKASTYGVLNPKGVWYEGHTGWNGRQIDPDTGEAYMIKVGKKAAGRMLDGREWNEMPEVYNE